MSSSESNFERLQRYEDDYFHFRELFESDGNVDDEEQETLDRIERVIEAIRGQLAEREETEPQASDAAEDQPTARGEASGQDSKVAAKIDLSGLAKVGKKKGGPRLAAQADAAVAGKVELSKLRESADASKSIDVPLPIPGGGVKIPRPEVQKCEIELVNKTDKTITMIPGSVKHAPGSGFESLPPSEIKPGAPPVKFVATGPQSVRVIGCKGQMAWQIDEKTQWEIEWHNPPFDIDVIRKPNGSAQATGSNEADYAADDPIVGSGNLAPFRYTLKFKGEPIDDPDPKPDEPKPDEPKPDEPDPVTPGSETDEQASCRVSVTNDSSSVLTLVDQGHDRGDFMTFPDKTIEPGFTTDFLSVETPEGDDDGCAGFLEWEVGDEGCTWRIEWDNPEQKKNTTTSELSGDGKAAYRELDQIAQGDENVPVSFSISDSGSPVEPPTEPPTDREPVVFNVLVMDKNSKEPISSALVKVGDQSRETGPPGKVVLQVRPGQQPYEVSAKDFDTESGTTEVVENEEFVVELQACGESSKEGLTVVVKDSESGEFIEAADVSIGDQSDTTSKLGLATVELPVGDHDYEVSKQGYDSEKGSHEIVEGDNPELVVELQPCDDKTREGLTIFVREKESGDPIPDADVTVGDQSDVTSSNGLATVELPVGEHDYDVQAKGFIAENGSVEIVEGDNEELVVELSRDDCEKAATLAVIVTDVDTSAPIPNADVRVGGKNEQTSASGVVVMRLEPGSHDYEVSAQDYDSESDVVEVEEGDDNELLVALKRVVTSSTLLFIVSDLDTGDAISEANVNVGGESLDTERDGTCRFEVEEGSHRYMVTKEGYQDATGSAEAERDAEVEVYVELEPEPDFDPPPESKQPTLRKGDESADGWVEYLQKLLNKHLGKGTVQVNGVFDHATLAAVERFQEETGCQKDGIVGNETWSSLRKGPREPIGTDGRKPHTFVEEGAETRWATEKNDFVSYDERADELKLTAFSVGDTPIKSAKATVRITSGTNGRKQTNTVPLGKAVGPAPTGAGQMHIVTIPDISTRFDHGTHYVEAYMDEKLGGDLWTGDVECGQPGGKEEGAEEEGYTPVPEAELPPGYPGGGGRDRRDKGEYQPVPEAELPPGYRGGGGAGSESEEEDVLERIGGAVDKGLDRLGKVADRLTNLMGKGFDRIGDTTGKGLNISTDRIGDAIKDLGQLVGKTLSGVGDQVDGPVGDGLEHIADVIEEATKQIDRRLDRLGGLAGGLADDGMDGAGEIVDAVGDLVQRGMDRLGDKIKRAGGAADGGVDKVGKVLKDGLSELMDAVDDAQKKLEEFARSAKKGGGGTS